MYPARPSSSLVPFAIILAAIGIHAQAATVTMITNNGAGQSWLTPAAWSDNLAAHAGDDYVVGANFLLRTPPSGSNAFPGDSLTLSGQFNLASGTGTTTTVNNLTLNNGVIVNASSGSTQNLNGSLHFNSGSSFIKSTGTTDPASPAGGPRNIVLDSVVTGGVTATAHFLRHGAFTLNNPANSFSGTWKIGGIGVETAGANPSSTLVDNSSNNISTLRAALEGTLGVNANVALDLWSRFDPDYDWATTGSLTLMSNGGFSDAIVMTLDQNITVGALTIAGSSLQPANYSYGVLFAAGFGDYFVDGGGSITVVPEPNVALIAAGGFGVFLISRRRRLSV
jgi:hypothetical protein